MSADAILIAGAILVHALASLFHVKLIGSRVAFLEYPLNRIAHAIGDTGGLSGGHGRVSRSVVPDGATMNTSLSTVLDGASGLGGSVQLTATFDAAPAKSNGSSFRIEER